MGSAAVVSPFGPLVRKVNRLIVPRPISQKSRREVRSWVTSTLSSCTPSPMVAWPDGERVVADVLAVLPERQAADVAEAAGGVPALHGVLPGREGEADQRTLPLGDPGGGAIAVDRHRQQSGSAA